MQTLGINEKYLRHFVNNIDSRHVVLQGSRRSGKSWAVLRWLRFLASGQEKRDVLCVAATWPALQLLIQDFQRSTGLTVYGSMKYGYNVRLPNGNRIMFRHFAHPEDAQGTTAHVAYIEEALNVPEQVIEVLSMSITEQIYFAYNPTRTSWVDKYILKDKSNYLKTTWKDNPWLTPMQIQEFENIKARALLPHASPLDIYNYKVYYQGEFSDASGRIFKLVQTCPDDEYEDIPVPEALAMDFGWVDNSDFTTLVGVKIWNGGLWCKEYLYSNTLANNKDLAFRLRELGIDSGVPIAVDTGGMGKRRCHVLSTADDGQWMEEEIREGFWMFAAKKGRILEGLNEINQYEIHVTESSRNLRNEMDNLEILPGGTIHGSDHAVDPVRYAVSLWKLNNL